MLLVGRGLESNDTSNITIEIKKMVWAITAALPGIIPNPVIPAISAMIKNKIALRIIGSRIFDSKVRGNNL